MIRRASQPKIKQFLRTTILCTVIWLCASPALTLIIPSTIFKQQGGEGASESVSPKYGFTPRLAPVFVNVPAPNSVNYSTPNSFRLGEVDSWGSFFSGFNHSDISPIGVEAEALFSTGLKLLHVFWYDLSRDFFHRAQQIILDSQEQGEWALSILCMSLWGEAMTHRLSLWDRVDYTAAREVLHRIPKACSDARSPVREYMNAVGTYYQKSEPEKGYYEKMKLIYQARPMNPEASALFSLAALVYASISADTALLQTLVLEARKVLETALKIYPNHPGLLHYAVHAFDYPDPAIARKSLEWGKRLAEIAPSSAHAIHMVSHTFIELSAWDQSRIYNTKSLAAGDVFCMTQVGLGGGNRSNICNAENRYHALEWLHYSLLQMCHEQEAFEQLERMHSVLKADPKVIPYQDWFARMYARQELATGIPISEFVSPDSAWKRVQTGPVSKRTPFIPPISGPKDSSIFWDSYSEAGAIYAGLIHVMKISNITQPIIGAFKEAKLRLDEILEHVNHASFPYISKSVQILTLMCEANVAFSTNERERWREVMEDAMRIDRVNFKDTASPTLPFQPPAELYGILLLREYEITTVKNTTLAQHARSMFEESIQRWGWRKDSTFGLIQANKILADKDGLKKAQSKLVGMCRSPSSNTSLLPFSVFALYP